MLSKVQQEFRKIIIRNEKSHGLVAEWYESPFDFFNRSVVAMFEDGTMVDFYVDTSIIGYPSLVFEVNHHVCHTHRLSPRQQKLYGIP